MKNKFNSCGTVKKAVSLTSLFGRLSLLIALLLPSIYSKAQEIVGEEVVLRYESSHPYRGGHSGGELVWSQTIRYTEKDASYIALHFSDVRIGRNDQLIVKSPDGTRAWSYSSSEINAKDNTFWSIPIYGNTVIVEIYSFKSGEDFGYVIDKIARGFTQTELNLRDGDPESICGDDDSQEAMCYAASKPTVYERGRAVARLWLNGIVNATGFLLGSEGHLMTCNHCIVNNTAAANTTVEVMAEGADCTTDCRMFGACPGTIEATSVTMVQFSCPLDYSLVQLPTNITPTYGFLQMRGAGPALGEQIYIVGHPTGWGKRVSFDSDSPQDAPAGVAHIHILTGNSCWCSGGANRVGYFADTRGGSSGSPVIAYSDHCVLAVHGCGGCPNNGANVSLIIEDLTSIPNDAIKAIEFPCGQGPDIVITGPNEIFDTDQDIPGDIIINSGAQLTVTATLRFGKGKGIRVARGAKLHVNGGTLTKCTEAEDWRGINVEGNNTLAQPSSPFTMPATNQAGVVLVNNNATIEWSRNAISTTRVGQSWNSPFWGGLVYCENSQFLNCRRAAEFMKYDFTNKSEFKNCTISNGGFGVTIWDTDGIDFDHCTFSNLGTSGVLVWDAGANIKNGCTFTGNGYGVQSNATSTVSSGSFLRIEKFGGAQNVFDGNVNMDIELRAGSLSKYVRIFDNLFKNTFSVGIWLDGRNSANVRRNAFINEDWAIAGQNIGLGNTTFYCNDLSQNVELGIYLENDNQRTKFLKNSFETNWLDFVLYGDETSASVHPDQRNTSTTPAGNCFSAIHHEHILTLAPTVSFNYHVLSSDPPPCQVPLPSSFGTNNYTTVPDGVSPPTSDDCGLDLDGDPEAEGPYVYSDYCTVKQEYLALKAQLDADPDNVQLLGETLTKEEEKEGIVAWFIRDAISFGSIGTAQAILNEEGTTESQRLLYGLKVQLNDYTGAQSILSVLPNGTQDEQWFRVVQEINLERLQSEGQFSLSTEQDSLLYVVANSKSPERGYARAILSLLKDEQFLPDIDLNLGEQRQNSNHPPFQNQQGNIISENKVIVLPNPSKGELEVVLDSSSAKGGTITVLSSTGKILSEYPLPESNRQTLHLTDLPNGIYLLQISSNNRIVGRTKLVISN